VGRTDTAIKVKSADPGDTATDHHFALEHFARPP